MERHRSLCEAEMDISHSKPSPSPLPRRERGAHGVDMDAIRELSKRIPITVRRARSLRQTQTPAERSLWNILRNRRFHGCKFRRQASIGPFIVDFYCPEYRLIVEVDGSIHDTQRGLDQWRQRKIEHDGYTVLRFTNAQILLSAENVLVEIVRFIDAA